MQLIIKNFKRVFVLTKKVMQHPSVFKTGMSKLFYVAKNHGFSAAKMFLLSKCNSIGIKNYAKWYKQFEEPSAHQKAEFAQEYKMFSHRPVISIVMPTYNTKATYLIAALESVLNQIYPYWELCIVDDASSKKEVCEILKKYQVKDSRIKVIFSQTNDNVSIATNKAIAMSTGSYVAFMDHDDVLTVHALFMLVNYINKNPEAKLLFSDEDHLIHNKKLVDPMFKPGWNPFLLEAVNYMCHLCVIETNFLKQLGGLRKGFEGSQDHDLMLRATEQLSSEQIIHIPYVLYHWRKVRGSLGKQKAASNHGVKSVQDHLDRLGIAAKVIVTLLNETLYRIHYQMPKLPPKISIIIPTRDYFNLLMQCIKSILLKTSYPNYEIIIVDNGSIEAETLQYFDSLSTYKNIKILKMDIPFNHSILNNEASKIATGEYLCFLNNDTEVISSDWLQEMWGIASRKNVAAVGAKLYYPNETIQHAGVVLGWAWVDQLGILWQELLEMSLDTSII